MGMTEQETLALGKKLYENIKHGADNIIETSDFIEYVEKSNVALEKQIAKKPVKRSFIVPYEGINVCPSCKEPLPSSKAHHCKCGQKLDWGNEDAE